jgi:hypothetical protein
VEIVFDQRAIAARTHRPRVIFDDKFKLLISEVRHRAGVKICGDGSSRADGDFECLAFWSLTTRTESVLCSCCRMMTITEICKSTHFHRAFFICVDSQGNAEPMRGSVGFAEVAVDAAIRSMHEMSIYSAEENPVEAKFVCFIH